jgi:hypothetical protein
MRRSQAIATGCHFHSAAGHMLAGGGHERARRVARRARAMRFRTVGHRPVEAARSAGAHRPRRIYVTAVHCTARAGCSTGAHQPAETRCSAGAHCPAGRSHARRSASLGYAVAATGAATHGSATALARVARGTSARAQDAATRRSARRRRCIGGGVARRCLGAVATAVAGERQRAANDHQQPRGTTRLHHISIHQGHRHEQRDHAGGLWQVPGSAEQTPFTQ